MSNQWLHLDFCHGAGNWDGRNWGEVQNLRKIEMKSFPLAISLRVY